MCVDNPCAERGFFSQYNTAEEYETNGPKPLAVPPLPLQSCFPGKLGN